MFLTVKYGNKRNLRLADWPPSLVSPNTASWKQM